MRQEDSQALHEILAVHGSFGHREHLELAWRYLRKYPIEQAAEAMVTAIRLVARRHGAEDKYHETMTRAWLQLVGVHNQRWCADSFDEFIKRNPALLDKGLIEHFYSRELISSQPARAGWSAPDLRPLPALA